MSSTARTAAERDQYLRKVLTMNPVQRAEELLTLRRRFHGIAGKKTSRPGEADTDVRSQRENVLERLEALREGFWTMPPAELKTAFSHLDAKAFPDLQVAIGRLKTVAENRARLAQLTQDPYFDGELFSSLKRVLVLPSRAAEGVREKTLRERQSRATIRRSRRMSDLLKEEVPEIHRLEESWFRRLARSPSGSAGGSLFYQVFQLLGKSSRVLGWVGFIVAIAVVRILARTIFGDSQ